MGKKKLLSSMETFDLTSVKLKRPNLNEIGQNPNYQIYLKILRTETGNYKISQLVQLNS